MPTAKPGALPPSEGPTGAFPDSASRGRSSHSFALSPIGLISGQDRRMPGAAEGGGAGGGGGDLREWAPLTCAPLLRSEAPFREGRAIPLRKGNRGACMHLQETNEKTGSQGVSPLAGK